MAVLVKYLTSLFNLSSLFRCTGIRVKLPYLPSHEVVRAKQERVVATLRNLQPPHSSSACKLLSHTNNTAHLFIYIYTRLTPLIVLLSKSQLPFIWDQLIRKHYNFEDILKSHNNPPKIFKKKNFKKNLTKDMACCAKV